MVKFMGVKGIMRMLVIFSVIKSWNQRVLDECGVWDLVI